MDNAAIKKMRINQLLILNTLVVLMFALFLVLTYIFDLTPDRIIIISGILMLFVGIRGLFKVNSTKSMIPIVEQVAIYEKDKMGDQWIKQRKSAFIIQVIVSLILLSQSFLTLNTTNVNYHVDFLYILPVFVGLALIMNISLIIHIRKVDNAQSMKDFKGYTLKTNIIGIAFGVGMAILFIAFTLFYVLSLDPSIG